MRGDHPAPLPPSSDPAPPLPSPPMMSHRFSLPLGLLLAFISLGAEAQEFTDRPEGGVWVMVNNLPGASQDVGKEILTYFNVRKGPPARVCHPVQLYHLLEPSRMRPDAVLILTDCGILPIELADKIAQFLDRGGRVIALGGTLFRNPVRARNGITPTYENLEWITPESIQQEVDSAPLERLLFEFDEAQLSGWSRNTNAPDHPTEYLFEPDDRFGKVLHARVADHTGWDAWVSPEISMPPEGPQWITSFWAKGGPNTTRLAVEWTERDGSRWFASVPLEPEWRRYLLSEKDFEFWESVPSRETTAFQSKDGARLSFGLALTHTGWLTGDQEFWVAEIGAAPAEARREVDWGFEFPPRDLLYPDSMSYPCSDVALLRTDPEQAVLPEVDSFRLPAEVRAFHPRPRAVGWKMKRTNRWVPLIEAVSSEGDHRGTVAALRLEKDSEGMLAGFAVEDPDFYRQEPLLECLRMLTARMLFGQFLWEGGSIQPTFFPGRQIRFGAVALPPGPRDDQQQ